MGKEYWLLTVMLGDGSLANIFIDMSISEFVLEGFRKDSSVVVVNAFETTGVEYDRYTRAKKQKEKSNGN